MKKSNISISDFTKRFAKFFKRFQPIIFFLAVSAALFIAIATLLPITSLSTKVPPSSGQTVDSTFDQAAIDRLQKNSTSSDSSYEPSGRKSPFTE